MVDMKCYHCGHDWDYKGEAKVYATCPDCHRAVKIEEAIVKKEEGKEE